MKTFISSLAIAIAITTLSACTKADMPVPTTAPKVEAQQVSRYFSEYPIDRDSFHAIPLPKQNIDVQPKP